MGEGWWRCWRLKRGRVPTGQRERSICLSARDSLPSPARWTEQGAVDLQLDLYLGRGNGTHPRGRTVGVRRGRGLGRA